MKPKPTFVTSSIAAVAGIALIVAFSGPSHIDGFASIVDGDTLKVGGRTVRLLGIDAPELGQLCTPSIGDATPYDCGMKARLELRDFISNRTVECELRGADRYKRALGLCSVEGHDLGRFLVTRGLAIAYGDSAYRYVSDERFAKADRAGIWSTFFDRPATWRANHDRHSR